MFNYQIIGEGKPVVFLHGFLESSSMWEVFDLSNAPFQSVLIDLPGHGDSPLSKEYESLLDIAEDLILFLEERSIQHYDLVGHSLGGYIAIEMHKLLQSKNKLVLFHSNFWEDDMQKKSDRNRVIEIVKKQKDFFVKEAIPNLFLPQFHESAFVQNLVSEALKITKESIILYSSLMRDRSSNEAYVQNLKDNLLFLQGVNDHIVPKEIIQSFENQFTLIYTEAGHMGHIEASVEEFEIMCNYLSFSTNQ